MVLNKYRVIIFFAINFFVILFGGLFVLKIPKVEAITIDQIPKDALLYGTDIEENACLEWSAISKTEYQNECLYRADLMYKEYYYTTDEKINFDTYFEDKYTKIFESGAVGFFAKPQWNYKVDGSKYVVEEATTTFSNWNNKQLSNNFWFNTLIDTVHATSTFLTSTTYTPPCAGNADILIVGGGGGSGDTNASGGGGGGGVVATTTALTVQAYTVTVGTGGTGGNNGQTSTFGNISAGGGGRGGYEGGFCNGVAGANGGGGCGGTDGVGGVGTFFNGGNGISGNNYPAGGGGGMTQNGVTPVNNSANGGNGGTGLTSTISGTPTAYGCGGGGGAWTGTSARSSGGCSSAGQGGRNTGGQEAGTDGTDGFGGGAGGNGVAGQGNRSGGDGVIIVAFNEAQCGGGSPPTSTVSATGSSFFDFFVYFQTAIKWIGSIIILTAVIYVLYSIGRGLAEAIKKIL